jgi:hypothetical protein
MGEKRKRRLWCIPGTFETSLILEFCRLICGDILVLCNRSDNGKKDKFIYKELVIKLGSEIHLLKVIIPDLRTEALEDEVFSAYDVENLESQEAKVRLHYAFRLFIRVVASSFAPLVLILDDLQWADENSIELIMDRDNSWRWWLGSIGPT